MLTGYGPYISVAVVLAVLFVLWAFFGGKRYDFVGLNPLAPETCGSYTGSIYNWGNITPAPAYDPINGEACVPADVACVSEVIEANVIPEITNNINNTVRIEEAIDITPHIASQFRGPQSLVDINSVQAPVCVPVVPTIPTVTVPIVPLVPILPIKTPAFTKPTSGKFVSKGERICTQTMENIYGVPFITIRPSWLRNPETGENLELDCYNDDLQIAVEYNGVQHYKWPNFTNQTQQQFINQVRRDEAKVEMCKRQGVYLIVVPYEVPHGMIPSFILSHLPETITNRLRNEQTFPTVSV